MSAMMTVSACFQRPYGSVASEPTSKFAEDGMGGLHQHQKIVTWQLRTHLTCLLGINNALT